MDPVVARKDTEENTSRLSAGLQGKIKGLTGRTRAQTQQSTWTAGQDPREPPDSSGLKRNLLPHSALRKTVRRAEEGSAGEGACHQNLAS